MVEKTSPKDDVAGRMAAALRDFPDDGRPDRTQDSDTMIALITRGYIQRHEQMKPCKCCGTERLDYAYFRVTEPGRTFLDQHTALQTLTDKVERYEETLREIASNTWSDWTVPRDKARATLTKDGM